MYGSSGNPMTSVVCVQAYMYGAQGLELFVVRVEGLRKWAPTCTTW